MKIRRAGVEDIETVVDLRMAFMREACPGKQVDDTEFREITRSYVADKLPKGEFLVWFAEEDGQVVGMSGLIFYHRPPTIYYPSEHQVYLLNMYTRPGYRRRGVATLLIQHMTEYVKTTPAKRITLHATETGRPVYERLGFVPINDEMVLGLEQVRKLTPGEKNEIKSLWPVIAGGRGPGFAFSLLSLPAGNPGPGRRGGAAG